MEDSTDKKPSLLIFYDYFYPGYKAGGPIQSLLNLVVSLEKIYSISVITSAYDLQAQTPYAIRVNEWNTVILPAGNFPISVWYGKKQSPGLKKIRQLICQSNPAVIYLNGMFSYRFLILPLVVIKHLKKNIRVIICPRGMLQNGALSSKSIKKKLYLSALKISGFLNNVHWHATNPGEKEDILKMVGTKESIMIAGNIARPPLALLKYSEKEKGRLRLVYLSLIAEKKNLFLLLDLVLKNTRVSLDIYGPVKDTAYWNKCSKIIGQHAKVLKYKGEVVPEKVQETFQKYDASILLTRGENFGHALYESMSAGRPVITSLFTPWNHLTQQKAGWNIDIFSPNEGVSLLNDLCEMPLNIFTGYCEGAYHLANTYYAGTNSVDEYMRLFSGLTSPAYRSENNDYKNI